MESSILIVVMAVALGTYIFRALPLGYYTLIKSGKAGAQKFEQFLSLAGPSLIAAFLAVSIVPVSSDISLDFIIRELLALGGVFLAHRKWKNPGLSVLIGVFVYSILISYFPI